MSLDREIEDLLAVEPSPEFVAKVRQRIAAEPAPRVWWLARHSLGEGGFSWRLAAAGAGFAVVVMAVMLWPEPKSATPAIAPAVAHDTRPVVSSSEAVVAAAPAPSHPRTFAPSNRSVSPVVMIQRDEAEAMNLLLTRVREGVLPDMTEALAVVDATGPEWIEIPPVVIEPIPSGEGE